MPTTSDNTEDALAPPVTRKRCAARWTRVPAAAMLFVLMGALASCTPGPDIITAVDDTSVTVIATASPVPVTPPASFEPAAPPTIPGYRLIFNDEFVGPKVNTEAWATSLPWGNTNRAEQQYYTPDALSQKDGVLSITARRQDTNGKPYASGIISSFERFSFTYGYAEIRAQVPAGTGLWPAFWLPTTVPGSNDEVDVMEFIGSDPRQGYAVLHYGTTARRERSVGSYRDPDFSIGFHTFGVAWEPGSLVWYVDGIERRRLTEHVPSQPMFLIANLAVGGATSWSGAPDRYTEFPAELKIDYIRVYQRD